MSAAIGYFEDEHRLLDAVRAARAAGMEVQDAFVPYAVHGLDEAMGQPRSRLTWVCFIAGLTGGALALTFELWTSVVSWPLNVGGKPFASVPAFIPVMFELTVLSAALTSAFAFLARSKLFPGKRATALPRVTDDRFALVLENDGPAVRDLLRAAGAVEITAGGAS
ncbi:MAG TPA: DUF3341 domain-containing protein [Polyangia bacterium]|nr:DUF3341 domain-containing protein [Polyangia bacterium]